MGTRNLICIWYKGRFMVAQYCQWDGYLEGQGATILQFLLVPGNIERLKKGVGHITPVNDETVQEILSKHRFSTFKNNKKVCECGAAVPFSVQETCFPPTLNRDTGAKIFDIIAAARLDDYIPIRLQLDFATDGLFCEYCYCVDLDAEVFEVFGGATRIPNTKDDEKVEPIGKNRFVEVCKAEKEKDVPLLGKSMPLLLKSWPLAQLPKDLDDMLSQVAADNVGESEYEDGGNNREDDLDKDEKGTLNDEDDKKAGDKDKTVTDGDDKQPDDANKNAVVPDEVKEKAEYEKNIERIAEDLLIESAQQEIRMEKERAAMQATANAGNKERTFTPSIRETK
ncbi:hypothetical protein EYB25_005986 [Talaromyces marneffei]|uniref:Uncharacterized protein n=1 Tax=Talaromyces marneffei (strain ATCC 18224 / CBS 334.59 / QM 7333) TaxID=441960 RepID=B6QIP9_TALMQ|nr:conserved hypothetical protein [Talaromyces marneffei ATCC 18224]KAE8552092.1 hypothetical protein EYB25_005986 [Talaromyces marneffei]